MAYRDDEEAGPHHIPPLTDDESDRETTADLHIRSSSQSSTDGNFNEWHMPLPVWLREASSDFRYRCVPVKIRTAARAVVTWTQGPVPPQDLKITPFFAKIQQTPTQLLDRFLPKRWHKICLLGFFYLVWFLTWSLMLRSHATSAYIEGYGRPQNLWCSASLWSSGNQCGVNGNDCRPFSGSNVPFRCPAQCDQGTILETHWVGNESHIFTSYVVGGPESIEDDQHAIYRGDSWICQAAAHAGVVSATTGGCGVLEMVGEHDSFTGSERHGITSFSFPASFRRSYRFLTLPDSDKQCPSDSRWPLFAVTAVALALLGIFTTSPAVFFFSLYYITMFHVGLVSDPPNKANFYELISALFGKLLPGSFIAYVIYITSARPLLSGLTAQFEKTILYLSFLFIGALNNYTFAPLIPIARLTPDDLRQPGAALALAIIIGVILSIALSQIYFIRLSGYLPKYLAIYAAMGGGLILLLLIPGERLRLHHYFYTLVLLPGTGFQTRPGLAYQSILMGLHINGVARWGFASIIETPASLGDVNDGQGKTWWGSQGPQVNATVSTAGNSVYLDWGAIPIDLGVDGVSIVVNDVERWRGYVEEMDNQNGTSLERRGSKEISEPWFVRLAWMNGRSTGRYSKPATWDVGGQWLPPPGTPHTDRHGPEELQTRIRCRQTSTLCLLRDTTTFVQTPLL